MPVEVATQGIPLHLQLPRPLWSTTQLTAETERQSAPRPAITAHMLSADPKVPDETAPTQSFYMS